MTGQIQYRTPLIARIIAATIAVALIVTGCSRVHGARQGWTEIEGSALAAEIAVRRDTLTIVDVREPELFQAGHLPGAINRPFAEIKARPAAEFEPGQNLVFVCHGGPMGAELAESLAARHYPRVRNLAGGMARWDGPVERTP